LQTFPFKDISPVIAMFEGILYAFARLINAVQIAVPAEGPSLGIPPSKK